MGGGDARVAGPARLVRLTRFWFGVRAGEVGCAERVVSANGIEMAVVSLKHTTVKIPVEYTEAV